jgi:basic amino acid/polyamine antiporter, APA family
MGRVQLWTSILKFLPLLFVSIVGLAFVEPANFATWNISGQSTVAAVGGAMALCLFSYIGVESASVAAARVRNPERNVPRATILGTLAAAVVYMLSLITVFGLVPNAELKNATAPFANATTNLTGAAWAGGAVALVVVISGFGALNGWTMLSAEMPRAAAIDGLFPVRFNRLSPRAVPAFGILVSAVLASVLCLCPTSARPA